MKKERKLKVRYIFIVGVIRFRDKLFYIFLQKKNIHNIYYTMLDNKYYVVILVKESSIFASRIYSIFNQVIFENIL